MRSPLKMGDAKLVDSMMLDGLIDAFHGYHMGITGDCIDHISFPIGRYLISVSIVHKLPIL